jgi:hypothetical protein
MGYYVNLENISMDEYKEILKVADLLPSRKILKNDIDEKFDALKEQQIENVEVLRKTLSNKSKLKAISKRSGIAEDYLKILIREVRSYRQKPNKIQDFPGVSKSVVQELDKLGISNTLQLFDHVLTPQRRSVISKKTGISESEIIRLAQLTDLSRIRWVNHTFAYVLLEAGYDSSEKVARADYKDLYERVSRLNEEREIYKGHIGLHDMKLCVEAARDVSLDFEY